MAEKKAQQAQIMMACSMHSGNLLFSLETFLMKLDHAHRKKIGSFDLDLDESSNFVGWIFMVMVARALSLSNMSIALFAAAPASHGLELGAFRFPREKSNRFPLALWNRDVFGKRKDWQGMRTSHI